MTDIKLNNSTLATASGSTISWGSGVPAGTVLQVVYSQKTDREQFSASTWTDIPGTDQNGSGSVFAASITPSSTSSKILVTVHLEISGYSPRLVISVRLYRGSTPIGLSEQIGSTRPTTFMTTGAGAAWQNFGRHNLSNSFLDSPSSMSSQTYSLKAWDTRDNGNININRQHHDSDGVDSPVGTSSIMLMEIAG